jgi:NMD protein affecting ribosome stability and mRNA decay
MSELKPCPFCGGEDIRTEPGINLNYCDKCSAEANIEHWNTRPIEDALNKRIAELEAEIERLTVHSDTERQDDNYSNHTQTQKFVYGKEREE